MTRVPGLQGLELPGEIEVFKGKIEVFKLEFMLLLLAERFFVHETDLFIIFISDFCISDHLKSFSQYKL